MINFKLKPYEWQKCLSTIMENINLSKIVILDDGSIEFDFISSNDGSYYKKIVCTHVMKINSEINREIAETFPCFICDIKSIKLENEDINAAFEYFGYDFDVPELDEYTLLCLESGDISINLICEAISII